MNIQTFCGPSRMLTRITTERSNIGNISSLGKLLTRKKKLDNTLAEIIDVGKDFKVY